MKKRLIIISILLLALGLVVFTANRHELPLAAGAVADKVFVEKRERRLTLLKNGHILKSYRVALGRNPEGKKGEEGDKRTPEGMYQIDRRKERSSYHRGLHISYPNPGDVAKAQARGVSPGGDVMIHGLPNALGFVGKLHLIMDWTLGCIAVTNPEIEEIWRAVPDGTAVEIIP